MLDAALRQLGWSVRTVALAPGGGEESLDLPVLGSASLSFDTLRALRSRGRNCLAIAHGSRTLPACALALLGSNRGFVYRNIGDPDYWSTSTGRRLRTRVALSRARAVVSLTERSARSLHSGFGVDASRITVIPNAADQHSHPPADPMMRARARAELGLPADVPTVAVLGALSREKGVDVAIDAMGTLSDFHLVIAGSGDERARLMAQASRVAPQRIHFLGGLHDPAPAYLAADVVALPSRTEGLPAVLIEAGLRAIPVVAADVGFVSDIVIDGETGVLVPPGDPESFARGVQRAYGQPSLGRAARAQCLARFELAPVAEQWDDLLRRLEHEPR
jgi:glycosyltransferase involved in cell wall biosynthesis